MKGRARAAGLNLCLDLDLDLPDSAPAQQVLTVHWDAGRIEQLLGNLLENSLRYTQAPGQVRLRLERSHSRVRVVVDDSAPGVPAAQLSQLFEPLYRGEAARQGQPLAGSGLGLSICQVIAHAHGGHLVASAGALGGLCLTLDLPLHPKALPSMPLPQPAGRAA